MKKKVCQLFFLFLLLINGLPAYCQIVFETRLKLDTVFNPLTSLKNGIIGTVGSGGRITVSVREKTHNTLIYQVYTTVTTTDFEGIENRYTRTELGPGATYFPLYWQSRDIKTSGFAMDRKYYDNVTHKPYLFLQNPMTVEVRIEQSGNAVFSSLRIPGIGVYGVDSRFNPRHYCYDASLQEDCPCSNWIKAKMPDLTKAADFLPAAHRGVWGDRLGAGAPENSSAAFTGISSVTPVAESDIMKMKDGQLVVSHDYNLDRLSNFPGSDREYLFDKNYNEIQNLLLRKKNTDVSGYHYLTFDDLLDLLVGNNLVLLVDIKELVIRNKDGVCIANCDYTYSTPEGRQKIKESWLDIFKSCYDRAKAKNAQAYLAFKVVYDYDDLKTVLTEDELATMLYLPMLQPSISATSVQDAVAFINSWHQKAGDKVVGYETNFKTLNYPVAQPFTYAGKTYENLFHYVYELTGLRSGRFSEEPLNPKGVANRWGEWNIKDIKTDTRGDHYELMKVPYGRIMLLTTDRPDIWNHVNEIFNR